MITEFLLSLCGLLCLYCFYQYAVYKPKGFPPGPPRIPIFGSYLFILLCNPRYLHKGALTLSKLYKTNIVGCYIGSTLTVIVHSAQGLREMLQNTDCDGRPGVYLAQIRNPYNKISGIFFQEGSIWKEQRRFILRHLRDYGFGRRYNELEYVIQEELSNMLQMIKNGARYEHEKPYINENGMRILLPHFFNLFSGNSVFHIIFNERKSQAEQKEMWDLIHHGMIFQRTADDYGTIISIIPWIRHIFPEWSSYNTLKKCNTHLFNYFEKLVDFYMTTYNENYERNFIDIYIKEIIKHEHQINNETTFTRNQLILSLLDFTFPAFTAVGVEISFIIQYLLLYPEVQKRVQNEIDEQIGRARMPSLDDRQYLHYTEACIREVLRVETLVPSNVPHKTLQDTNIMGYTIPKGTFLFPSLYAYHNDKTVWSDPANFRPERFLNDGNKLCLKSDMSLPFGAGKRICAGETFARNMLFVIIATLCQNFNIVLGKDDKLPDPSTNLSGLITSPIDFWVQLEERNL